MANQTLTLPIALRGGSPDPVVNQIAFGVNTWKHVEMRINSTDWNTIGGLFLGYSARVSIDNGISWYPWGGFTATSPTFAKDNVTKLAPGGYWLWSDGTSGIPSFFGGGLFEITVNCPTAFNWGATVNLFDTL